MSNNLQQAENKIIAGMIDRLRKDHVHLKKILDANDNRLEKASGREWNLLQERVGRLASAYGAVADAVDELSKI